MTKRIAIISVFILILINFKAHSSNIVIDHLANQEVFFGIDSIANTYNNKPAFDNNKSNSIIYTKVFITREARTRYFRVQYIRGDVGSRWEAVTITAKSYLNAELEALVLYRIPEEFRAEFWNRVYGGRPTIAGLQPIWCNWLLIVINAEFTFTKSKSPNYPAKKMNLKKKHHFISNLTTR